MIDESERLQNNPSQGQIPREDIIVDIVCELLQPYADDAGCSLTLERHTYVKGRSNLIIEFGSSAPDAKVVSFVGMHMDGKTIRCVVRA